MQRATEHNRQSLTPNSASGVELEFQEETQITQHVIDTTFEQRLRISEGDLSRTDELVQVNRELSSASQNT